MVRPETKLGKLLFGVPTESEFTYKVMLTALEEAAIDDEAYKILLENSYALEFVHAWHAGIPRRGSSQAVYMQHVLATTCMAISKKQPEHIVWACYLKAIAQRRPTYSKFTHDDYLELVQSFNDPLLTHVLSQLGGISNEALGIGLEAKLMERTWDRRKDLKFQYLKGLGICDALLVELMSKFENLQSDIRDICKTGNKHWAFFHGKIGDEINYFKACLEIFKPLSKEYPFAGNIAVNFEKLVAKIKTLNKKPIKAAEQQEGAYM